MIPGRVGPKQMRRMMKQMGVSTEELNDVQEVVIRTKDKRYVFKDVMVSVVTVQGQKTFQVIGEPEVMDGAGGPTESSGAVQESKFTTEDVKLVSEQAGVDEDEARKALEECDGALAEAILKLMTAKKS